MTNIDLRHMKAFIVLASYQHFGRAAENLNMAQPQLSRLLKFIEDEVGVPLVDRSTRKFSLTPAGETFLDMARKTSRLSMDSVAYARAVGRQEFGVIRIGYMDFAINRVVPMFLRSFQGRIPNVKVELEHLCTEGQRGALIDNRLDVGFLIGPFFHDGVSTLEVSSQRLMVYLPEVHPLANRGLVELGELANEDFIFGKMVHWRPFRELVERECMGSGFVPRVIHEPFNSDGIFGLVSAGLGITIYPEREARINPRGVVMKPLKGILNKVHVIAAWKEDNPSSCLAEFLDVVRQRVAVA